MKKIVSIAVKVLCFFIIFVLLFLAAQWVFSYKGASSMYFQERFDSFARLAENEEEVDVVFLGSSPIYRGVSPAVIYKETGITTVNFGRSVQHPMTEYYCLKSLMKVHTPKAVVLDLIAIFNYDKGIEQEGEDRFDFVYMRTLDSLPNWGTRMEMIGSMLEENEDQNYLDLMIPMFRYHTKWQNLAEKDYSLQSDYREYLKGWGLVKKNKKFEDPNYVTEDYLAQEAEPRELDPNSVKWYEKTLKLCEENNVQVLAVSMPYVYSVNLAGRYRAFEDFCMEKGISYLNYATKEQAERIGVDSKTDFYDQSHLSSHGAVKISKVLAQDIQALFSLEDRRGDPKYAEWDTEWETFYADYKTLVDEVYYNLKGETES